jgi:hypothetical protein
MTRSPSEKPALFKVRHFNHLLIHQAVRWYVTYKLSYRDVCDLINVPVRPGVAGLIGADVLGGSFTLQLNGGERRRYKLLVVLLIAGEAQRHAQAAACGLWFQYARCLAVGYMWKACCLNPARRDTPKEAGR